MCCAEGFECLSNGLCNDYRYDNYERVLRGGCTDKNWGDGCPKTCTSIWPQGDEKVYVCSDGKFCCGRSADCCNDSSAESFDFGSPSVIATAGKTQAQATSAPEQDDPEPTSKAEQQQSNTQTQEQQQQTKASSQPTEVTAQDEPQETQSGQQGEAAATTKAKASSAGESDQPAATDASANTSQKDNSDGSSVKADGTQGSQTDVTKTTAQTAPQSDATNSASPATGSGGPAATNTVNNYITTPSSNNNTVAIAVGVGVSVGVLIFLLAVAGCWYIRRKQRGPSLRSRSIFEIGESEVPPVEVGDGASAVGSEKRRRPFGRGSGMVFELDGARGVELPGGNEAKEVSADNNREDNDAGDRKWPSMFRR